MLDTPEEILAEPDLLAGRLPDDVEAALGSVPGWQVERLGRGSRRGQGWVLREYDPEGNPTGSYIRWHPGGGHHGRAPYWRVGSARYGRSKEIR